jgi:hypothetical protein
VTETPSARRLKSDDPDPTDYELAMFNNGEDQYVKLSRDEFIELKTHLAKLRGYPLPKVSGQ